jgi:type 1 glutamine amidotransferase
MSGSTSEATKVLVLCDDYWHPARTAREGVAPLTREGFQFDFIENAGDWTAEKMDAFPVVLFTKSNDVSAQDRSEWMTEPVQQAFVDYVNNGAGLLVVHSGTADYADASGFRKLIGGVFEHHPPQCPVTVTPDPAHALSDGSAPFTLQDEHYHMLYDAGESGEAELFVTAQSEHGTQPAGWTRSVGAGRVCVLTPGHNLEVWLHPSYQALLGNALRWCNDG